VENYSGGDISSPGGAFKKDAEWKIPLVNLFIYIYFNYFLDGMNFCLARRSCRKQDFLEKPYAWTDIIDMPCMLLNGKSEASQRFLCLSNLEV
jgi:hypothetical protein